MSKSGVLGNDPFKRGAAKPGEPTEQPVKPLAEVKPEAPQPPPAPPPPPKLVVPTPKTGEGTPAKRAVQSFASKPQAPKVTAPERPSGKKPSQPSLSPEGGEGRGEGPAAEPRPIRQVPRPPPPPFQKPVVREAPQLKDPPPAVIVPPPPPPPPPRAPLELKPHPGSPSFGPDPIPHPESPYAAYDPEAHEGSPVLRAGFTAHGKSPEAFDIGGGTTPHAGSPAVVRELEGSEPLPHLDSPEMVGDRVTTAIGAAREVTEGLAKPFIEAASGLYQAAKSALGFGAAGPVDTWGKDEALTKALHPVGDFLYDTYFRVTVEGADHLPQGASIIVANHSGALPLDGPMLQYALQRERSDLEPARWLVEDQIFHAPMLGVLMNRLGAVRAHPDNAVRLLQEGRPVIVFPEGFLGISKPFTQRYQLKRFGRGGYVKLALKEGVSIIPAAIVGAEESMPLLAKLPAGPLGLPYLPLTPPPLPARWKIRFAEPVTLDGEATDLPYVQEQNDRIRDTIAGMLESMLKG